MSSFNSFEDKANILRAGKSTPAVSDSVNFKSRAIFKRATQKAYLLITYVGAGTWVHLFSSFFHTFRVPRIYIPLTRSHQTKLSHFRLHFYLLHLLWEILHARILKCWNAIKVRCQAVRSPHPRPIFPDHFPTFPFAATCMNIRSPFSAPFFRAFFPLFSPYAIRIILHTK